VQITLRGQPILTMDEFKHSKTHAALLKCGHMLIDDRPLVFRYAMPIVTVGAASLLASLLPWRVDPSHFTLYFLAVVVSAWYGGVGAGLLSTVLSALALDYFFISPIYSIEMDAHALVRLCVFLSVSIITNILTNARRRAETALRQAHMELEDRVEERTAELAQTNSALREEISERQKLEKELYRVQHQIGRVERLATLGRMTGTVAHDLGTPLNSVLGYTQLLAQEDLPERARRRLAIIETQIHRMGEIIQNYLAYTRGNPPQEIISVNDLIRDTLLLLQPVFKQRDVQVGVQLGESLPPVLGDGNSIQRVLINLLDNAIDACEQRGSITLRTYAAENSLQQRQDVIIECADSGAGIEAEILPKVFELFVTTKAPGKGTGMGLVICQEIVRAHGGDINIKSDPTTGTIVTVFLPVNVNSQSAAGTEESHEHSHTDS
jgi:C4-dicarboxylate-specific signal transduction histidine kinase